MTATPRLPGFVIIGAVKAATTWVAHQLRCQPGIFLPKAEPHFFSTEYDRGDRWYAGLFADAPMGALIGEKSADYLAHPYAAPRLAASLPAARLVVQLRNPVDRAYSDYCMLFRRGTVDGRIDRHLRPGGDQPRFLKDGLYWRHIQRFLDHFPAENLHVLLYDDVAARPSDTLAAVARHIGYPQAPQLVRPAERQNDSRAALLPLPLRRTLAPLKPLVAPLRRRNWFKALHGSLARPADYPPFTDSLRQSLADHYAADVAALGRFLGRDLGAWLESDGPTATSAGATAAATIAANA